MPGIVGLITKMPREWAEPQLRHMVAALRHESFHRAGTWIDESLGVYVGWTAIEGSFADCMPLRDSEHRRTLIFSGEAYGEEFARVEDECQASPLLRMATRNSEFFSHLNGVFHGIVSDAVDGSVRLFNDRYGMHRLCYHEASEAFYFGAEAKAILAARPELRRPSVQGLGEFLACSCVLENRTIFESINVIPAGSCWTFRDGALKQKSTYFDAQEWEKQPTVDADAYYEGLKEALQKNLPHYFDGPLRTGTGIASDLHFRRHVSRVR